MLSRSSLLSRGNLSVVSKNSSGSLSLLFTARRTHTALQSEKAQPHWSNKVMRKDGAHKYFSHPMYVMTREKILNKIWREHVLLNANWWYVTGFLGFAYAFKA